MASSETKNRYREIGKETQPEKSAKSASDSDRKQTIESIADRLDRANCSNIKYFTVSLISSKLQNATTADHRGGGQAVLAAPHVALSPAVSVDDRG